MKILLTTDGSTYSKSAAQALTDMIRPEGTEVLVLEVVEPLIFTPPPQMAPGYQPEQAVRLKEQFKDAEATTAQTATKLRNAGFKAESRVIESDIRSGILNVATEWKPDLIVMGSHGRRGVEKFLLGSVAESVARHAKSSVLIVRGMAKPAAAQAA
jgi:nucleotide-binding universal stress UspA family protein